MKKTISILSFVLPAVGFGIVARHIPLGLEFVFLWLPLVAISSGSITYAALDHMDRQ